MATYRGYLKASGSWKNMPKLGTRISSIWKKFRFGYVRVSGVWKKFFINTVYGFFCGGYYSTIEDVIDYIDMTLATGNAIDRGNLTIARYKPTGVTGFIYGFYGGGWSGDLIVGAVTNIIDYVDKTLISGNAIDRGDLTVARNNAGGVSGPVYGFYGGGDTGGGYAFLNIIDYINITTTTGNAVDRGDLSVGRELLAGVSGPVYGFYGGGEKSGGFTDIIDYINMSLTTGNAVDRGDLSVARRDMGSAYGPTWGYFAGGFGSNVIDRINMTLTTGNATDTGDLTANSYGISGVSGPENTTPIFGFFGGIGGGTNGIDLINVTGTGNSLDRGDLSQARGGTGGVP